MSRIEPTDYERAQLRLTCSYCGAGDGDWCVAESGHPARCLHGARHWAVMEIIYLYDLPADIVRSAVVRRGSEAPS